VLHDSQGRRPGKLLRGFTLISVPSASDADDADNVPNIRRDGIDLDFPWIDPKSKSVRHNRDSIKFENLEKEADFYPQCKERRAKLINRGEKKGVLLKTRIPPFSQW
jgi:hypothetical protein